jgi:hypothetical protein
MDDILEVIDELPHLSGAKPIHPPRAQAGLPPERCGSSSITSRISSIAKPW